VVADGASLSAGPSRPVGRSRPSPRRGAAAV